MIEFIGALPNNLATKISNTRLRTMLKPRSPN